ncbi:MAG: antibiotic biosynthesis monooxygenase [Nitrospirota bacterium]|nr:antibiotic biosynthesis monooxygenase [Nitrospirota bacterium]
MIRMMVVAKVKPHHREEFLQTMRSLQKGRREEDIRGGFRVYEEIEDSNDFSLIDEWETDEDMNKYCSREGFRVLRGALRVLCTEVEISYGTIRRIITDGEGRCVPGQ